MEVTVWWCLPGERKICDGHGHGWTLSALPSPEPGSKFSTCQGLGQEDLDVPGFQMGRTGQRSPLLPPRLLEIGWVFQKHRVYTCLLCLEVTVLCPGTFSTASNGHQGTQSSILLVLLQLGGAEFLDYGGQ